MAQTLRMEAPAIVVSYDPKWPDQFEWLRGRVDAALGGVIHQVEHVGSTAVPGLDAKPIIDIDVVVPDPSIVTTAVAALTAAGWRHQGDLGIAGREAFSPPDEFLYHHLYVVVQDQPAHRDHVDLRDYLRAHPDAAAEYGAVKRSLAHSLGVDRSAYAAGKSPTIEALLAEARRRPR